MVSTGAKQLYHFGIDSGQCDISLPCQALAHGIDYYWLLTLEHGQIDLEVIPDMAIDLVMSPSITDFAALYLPVENKFSIALSGPIQYAGVCFRTSRFDNWFPHSLDALRKLASGTVTINMLGVAELVSSIQGLNSLQPIAAIFDTYWAERALSSSVPVRKARRLSHEELLIAIQQSLGLQGIDSVCTTLGVSDRQLRRLSHDMLGLTPKKIQSIFRLQAALSDLLSTQRPELTDLYYDDSHRIRELKKLTGFTPTQIRDMAEKYNTQ